MSETVGRLTVALDARISQFEANVAKAERRLTRGAQKMTQDTRQIDAGFAALAGRVSSLAASMPLLGAAMAGLSGGAMVAMARRAIDTVGGLGELADQAGVSTDALQALTFAGVEVGVNAEGMQRALERLTRTVGDAATGNATAEKAFADLGIAFRDAAGNARPTEAVLVDVAEKIKAIENPAERAAAATALFGDRIGQRMLPFLLQGREGLERLTREAIEFGTVADADLIASADKASDALAKLQLTFGSLANNMIAEVAPALTTVLGLLDRIMSAHRGAAPAALLSGYRTELTDIVGQIDGPAADRGQGLSSIQLSQMSARATFLRAEIARLDTLVGQNEARVQAALGNRPPAAGTGDGIPVPPPQAPPVGTGTGAGAAERDPGRNPLVAEALRQQNEALSQRNRLIEQNQTPEEAYASRLERLGALVARFEGTDDELPLPTVTAEANDALADYEAALRRAGEASKETANASKQFGSALEGALENAVTKGGKLKDVLAGLASDLTRIALSSVWRSSGANALLSGAFSAIVGGVAGAPVASAKGNAFSGGSVIPFANGGITAGPTMFPMAGGQTGLMGEAGPEAIMPLGRDRYGRMGVRAQGGGGGVTVNQSNNFASNVSAADMARFGQQIKRETMQAIVETRRESGRFLA